MRSRWVWAGAVVSILLLVPGSVPRAEGGERYAVVVTGASGGDVYAEKYDRWRNTFVATLRGTLGYKDDHVLVLAEHVRPGVLEATRENVQRVFSRLRATLTNDDQLLVLLVGHGTADGDEGKFNLVGPDLTATEWAALVNPMAGRQVFVDTTGASFPFLHALAARNRIVITATDAAVQQFETVFGEYFVKAFTDAAADADTNHRVSVWEAFSYASAGVRQWFDQRGQLPTERPLLDDTGAGIGREAQNPGIDGAVARVTYLSEDGAGGGDAVLLRQRAALERELADLEARKASMSEPEYEGAFEQLMLDIAKVNEQLKNK